MNHPTKQFQIVREEPLMPGLLFGDGGAPATLSSATEAENPPPSEVRDGRNGGE